MKNKIVIFILSGVCTLFLVSLLIDSQNETPKGGGAIIQEGIIPGYTAEQIQEMMQREADESTFSFEINSRPVFETGDAEGPIRIANPPYNAYAIQVEITLDINQEVVFSTEMLKPNQYIEHAKLHKKLTAGEYPATATIKAYNIETNEFVGMSSAKIIITVKQ